MVILGDGSKVILGIMFLGSYEFGIDFCEIMEILFGDLRVLFFGEEDW